MIQSTIPIREWVSLRLTDMEPFVEAGPWCTSCPTQEASGRDQLYQFLCVTIWMIRWWDMMLYYLLRWCEIYTFLMWQALLSPFMWLSENVKSQDIQMCSDSWLGQIDVSKAIRSETYLFSTHFWSLDSDFYIFHLEICCVAIPLYDDMLIAIEFIYKPLHVLRQTRLMEFVFRPQITSRVGQLTFITL